MLPEHLEFLCNAVRIHDIIGILKTQVLPMALLYRSVLRIATSARGR